MRRQLRESIRVLRGLCPHANLVAIDAVFVQPATVDAGAATAYVQLPLYTGGALAQWLRREENAAPFVQPGPPPIL